MRTCLVLILALLSPALGQQRPISWKRVIPTVASDQKRIWTYPVRAVREHRWAPALGVLGVTAGLIAADPHDAPQFRRTTSFRSFNSGFSGRNTDLGTMHTPVSLYAAGLIRKDSYQQKTALLAGIAVASAASARRFLGVTPRVAMLSFSTAGSASHAEVDKVKRATRLAAERITDGYVDGEMQFDTAVDPGVAAKKGMGKSEVAGKANVLIFPDLNSGNTCYKAVNRLAGAPAIGPILQGFAKPVNDLSRGAKVEDVVGTTIITVLQGGAGGE